LEASFQELQRSVPATVGIAIVSADGKPGVTFGNWSVGVAWSTIKVPLAIAAMRAGVDSDLLVLETITRSDNAAAETLWSRLGDVAGQYVQTVIREAGDAGTLVESRRLRAEYTPFGQTRWSLADQARFAAGLSQVSGSSPVIQLMGELTAEHRWGLAAKGYATKGGWGPGLHADYLIRQFAIVSGDIGVALAAEVPDGSYEAGVDVVDSLADWVVAEALTQK
jgi:hypothetical protein